MHKALKKACLFLNIHDQKGSALAITLRITSIVYLVLLMLFFVTGALNNVTHVFFLRILRSYVFSIIIFSLLQIYCYNDKGLTLFHKRIALSFLVPGVWFVVYTHAFILFSQEALSDLGSYYIVCALLFFLSFIALNSVSVSQNLRIAGCILYGFVSFLFLLPPIFYAGYAYFYTAPFDEYVLLSILATTQTEAVNYVTQTFAVWQFWSVALILLFLLAGVICAANKVTKETLSFKMSKALVVFIIVAFAFLVHYTLRVFPLDQYRHLQRKQGPMDAFFQLKNNLEANTRTIRFLTPSGKAEATAAQKIPGTILLVIGESACRDRMKAFSPEFPYETTPWETSVKNTSDFIFHDQAYACFPNTIMALTQALTNSNQYNQLELKNAVSIIDIAEQSGYKTYWLSTQGRSSVSDAGVTLIAQRAQTLRWLNGYDSALLPELKKINPNVNNFVILHIQGSHFRYKYRYPEDFSDASSIPKENPQFYYDTSLLYSDALLKEIYTYAKNNLNLVAMMYCSDHGEDMQYTHMASPFRFSMVRIPLWVYLSPKYQQTFPEVWKGLRKNKHKIFTNDVMFDTISGILHAHSNYYDVRYDLSSDQYSITIGNALTLNGKRAIKEDIE